MLTSSVTNIVFITMPVAIQLFEGEQSPIYIEATKTEFEPRRQGLPKVITRNQAYLHENGEQYLELSLDRLGIPRVVVPGEVPNIKVEPYTSSASTASPEDKERLIKAVNRARPLFKAMNKPIVEEPVILSNDRQFTIDGQNLTLTQGETTKDGTPFVATTPKGRAVAFMYNPEGPEFDTIVRNALIEASCINEANP